MPGISQISPARPRSSPGVTRAPASEIRASDFRACEYGAACEDTKNSCPPGIERPRARSIRDAGESRTRQIFRRGELTNELLE
jgi:hypothetical protein